MNIHDTVWILMLLYEYSWNMNIHNISIFMIYQYLWYMNIYDIWILKIYIVDLLSILVYIIMIHETLISAEIEMEYIWSLIHPSFLIGQAIFYLTAFSSAVWIIKNLQKSISTNQRVNNNTVSVRYMYNIFCVCSGPCFLPMNILALLELILSIFGTRLLRIYL